MKFLDETGLSYFLDKLKTFIKGKYVGINDPITISGGGDSLNIQKNQITLNSATETVFTLDRDGLTLGVPGGEDKSIYIFGNNSVGTSITPTSIIMDAAPNNYYLEIDANKAIFSVSGSQTLSGGNILTTDLTFDTTNGTLRVGTNDELTEIKETLITSTNVETDKFIKKGGTSSQLLVADGSVAEFNKANGVPKLNASGKIDSSQVDALTNAEIDAIVI